MLNVSPCARVSCAASARINICAESPLFCFHPSDNKCVPSFLDRSRNYRGNYNCWKRERKKTEKHQTRERSFVGVHVHASKKVRERNNNKAFFVLSVRTNLSLSPCNCKGAGKWRPGFGWPTNRRSGRKIEIRKKTQMGKRRNDKGRRTEPRIVVPVDDAGQLTNRGKTWLLSEGFEKITFKLASHC